MKINYFFVKLSIIFLIAISCTRKPSNEEVQVLIEQSENYSDQVIEPVINGINIKIIKPVQNAFTHFPYTYRLEVLPQGGQYNEFLQSFATWLVKSESFSNVQMNNLGHEIDFISGEMANNGIKYFSGSKFVKIWLYGNQPFKWELSFYQKAKPKIIGIRSLGHDEFEVAYTLPYCYGQESFISELVPYLQKIGLPNPIEKTINLVRYGDVYKIKN